MSLVGSVVPAGTCGDPASQCGKLKALRKMPEREPLGSEFLLRQLYLLLAPSAFGHLETGVLISRARISRAV